MVLSVEEDIVFIALAVWHHQCTRLERKCWTWILWGQVYGAHQALIYQHPCFQLQWYSDIVISYQRQLSKWGNDPFPLNVFCWNRYLTSKTNHWAIWLADLEGTGKVSCNKLQETEQCSKLRDSYLQLLKVARDMLQAGTHWEICCCNKNCCN